METSILNTVTLEDGREAVLGAFNALDGYEIKYKFIDAYDSKDYAFKRALLVQVLSHVTLDGKPLNSETAINALCSDWRVALSLYDAALAHNGITFDLFLREKKPEYEAIGADLGAGFVSEVVRLYGPMLELAAANAKKGE
ncbi:hypothetical protein WJ542_04050 [Paraburkholderia sp. B3]|uniref:hypothetical protein n=1 Tax=Paraburkholderia sp. B3 TaxID=3134791 RepID=UPI00398284C2